ncbi:uncharacterized protein LOC144156362 isoform X3 [Haemaphysalis longicornis]
MRKRRVFLRGPLDTASGLLACCCLLANVLAASSSDSRFLKEDIFFEILEPESLRYTFRLRPAHEFGSSFVAPLSNVGLVLSEPWQGCASLVNRLEVRHNVVLVERGSVCPSSLAGWSCHGCRGSGWLSQGLLVPEQMCGGRPRGSPGSAGGGQRRSQRRPVCGHDGR